MYKHTHGKSPSVFVNYFIPTSHVNPYNLRSSSNYRPVYSCTDTRKFSMKHIGTIKIFVYGNIASVVKRD